MQFLIEKEIAFALSYSPKLRKILDNQIIHSINSFLNSSLYYEDSEILFDLTLASVIFIQFIKECY